MHYEITNAINENSASWQEQRKRTEETNGTIVTLAATPATYSFIRQSKLKIVNLVDFVSGISYGKHKGIFFNKADVPEGSEVFMNANGSISIIHDGDIIGSIELYQGTRRYIRSINYDNRDGSRDFVEEFTQNGQKYSRLYYSRGKLQRVSYFNSEEQVVLDFYVYDGKINFISISNPHSHKIEKKYDTIEDFWREQISRIVSSEDTVGITSLGPDLQSVTNTSSSNTLYFKEDPLDESGKIKGNLEFILKNDVKFIDRVYVTSATYKVLSDNGLPMDKVNIYAK